MGTLRKIAGNILGNQVDNARNRVGDALADLGFDLPISDIDNPQRAYMWEFNVEENEVAAQSVSKLRMFAMSSTIPERTNNVIKRYHKGVYYHFIGKNVSPRTITLKFFDAEEGHVYRYWSRWWQRANIGTGNASLAPSALFKNASVRLRDVSDSFDTQSYNMLYCFPTNIGTPSLTYDESGLMTFEVTLSFIDFKIGGEV